MGLQIIKKDQYESVLSDVCVRFFTLETNEIPYDVNPTKIIYLIGC